jgi:hypothetical protein
MKETVMRHTGFFGIATAAVLFLLAPRDVFGQG